MRYRPGGTRSMWDALLQACYLMSVSNPANASEFHMDDAKTQELRDQVAKAAQTYGVDASWLLAIILKESGGNRYAIRYEPNYKNLFQVESIATLLHVSLDTEIQAQKISWGLGQIMGALAREQGHQGLMAELIEPEVNIKHMCIRIKALKRESVIPNDIFAMYNGGPGVLKLVRNGRYPNQKYVNDVNRYLKNLKF